MDNVAELYEVFGVDMPTDNQESGQMQEVAEPAEETSENIQEVAEPDADVDTDVSEEVQEKPVQEPKHEPMPKEQRAANAKLRRQQEIDDAVTEALKKERASINERVNRFLSQAKIRNAHAGGAEIKTLDDAEAWAEADRQARMEQDLKKGRLTPEAIQTAVENSPTMRAMKDRLEDQTKAMQQASQQQFQKSVEVELAEIQKLDPTIQNLTDILNKPEGKAWAGYVQRNNMNYLDAYKLAFHDQIVARAQTAAQTGAAMKERGKSHLKASGARGQGAVEVPARVKEYYRQFQPDMTDAEIMADYNKRLQE